MNILYIAAIRLPTDKAHGLQILKTCEAFAQKGDHVELLVPRRQNTLTDDPFVYYGVSPIFKITSLQVPDLFTLGRIGFMASLVWFAEVAHMRKSFWTADAIYSRDAFVLAQYVLLGRPLVYEAHTKPTVISTFVARRAKRVVVISEGLREEYERLGVKKERIIVAPDAIDLETFSHPISKEESYTRLGLPHDKKIALYIGRLDGWKGVNTLCEASTLLPTTILVAIIGGDKDQIVRLAKKYPKVVFLGYRPYRELADNQAAADVLILPNTAKDIDSVRYTSPLKLFTYMAANRPIVVSDLPSIREVLDEESAFFFVPDDAKSLADTIVHTLENSEIANRKAQKASELVHKYTWQTRADTIISGLERATPTPLS